MAGAILTVDALLFGALPYVALTVFLLASIARYRGWRFSYSSLSSQFLENRQHFWGLVPFHYGILAVLSGHLLALLIPSGILAWNARPLRLYALEITGLAFGVLTLVGLTAAVVRRATVPSVRAVTNARDWMLFALLGVQVLSGLGTAVLYPWGSSWYAAAAAPYLWSIARLAPDITAVAVMPWLVKVHIATAFVLLAYAPFSRLVHVLVAPIPYLWRKPQIVRWYRGPEVAS
jgi:nitrate reductase gamma subunit